MSKRDRKKEASKFCITLGKHIRATRKNKELSVAEVAFKADIDSQNLRKYELGKQEMKVSMLSRIAEALDISISELMIIFQKNN